MVLWGDGEESSTDLSSDGSSAVNTIYDSDFSGIDDGDAPTLCKHQVAAGKFVDFEGWCIGRRFLGCAMQEGEKCDYVKWIDPEWPSTLQNAIGKLWEMYKDVKRGRVNDTLDFMEKSWKCTDEKEKLHKDLRNVQDEHKKAVQEKQVTLAFKAKAEQALLDARAELEQMKVTEACHSNMHKVPRIKAQMDRDQFKADKRKMEFIISNLLKLKEETRGKMRKIRELYQE